MADTRISELSAETAAPGDEIPVNRGGTNYKITAGDILKQDSGTLTADAPALDLTQTWNNSGVTFTGVKLNVTDTASASGSLLMDLQVGGTSKFKVTKDAKLRNVAGIYPGATSNDGILLGAEVFKVTRGTSTQPTLTVSSVSGIHETKLSVSNKFGWTSGGSDLSQDLILARDDAGILAQRNGTNPQTFRIYNTIDGSDYERGFLKWNANVLEIGTEAGGLGTARSCKFGNIATGEYFETNPNGTPYIYSGGSRFTFGTYYFGFGTASGAADVGVSRPAAGIVRVSGSASTNGGSLEFLEQTAPAAPSANAVRIYAEDDGAGKTRLMALFPTGAAQQIAIEP